MVARVSPNVGVPLSYNAGTVMQLFAARSTGRLLRGVGMPNPHDDASEDKKKTRNEDIRNVPAAAYSVSVPNPREDPMAGGERRHEKQTNHDAERGIACQEAESGEPSGYDKESHQSTAHETSGPKYECPGNIGRRKNKHDHDDRQAHKYRRDQGFPNEGTALTAPKAHCREDKADRECDQPINGCPSTLERIEGRQPATS